MSLSVQFLSLLAMIGTGIVAATFIDMIGTGTGHAGKRSFIRKKSRYFEIVGWVIAGCMAFVILYVVRDGAWRIYDPFAQMSGMLLYASFLHKPFRFIGRIVLFVIIRPIWFVIRLIIFVIRHIFDFVLTVVKFFTRPVLKLFRKYFRKHFKNREK